MAPIINVALPVFGIILAGYLSGRFEILGEHSSEALNRFVYWFALPPLLFLAMARVPAEEVFNLPFLAAFAGAAAITFAISFLVGGLMFPNRLAVRTLQGLTAVFANSGYMGIPLFLTAFGPEGTLPAIIATLFNSAFFIGFAVVLIEIDLLRGGSRLKLARDVLLALVRNPLVSAPGLGLLVSLAGLPVPTPLETFCNLLGAAAGPAALFALGLFLVGKPIRAGMREIAWITGLKLVVHPLLTWIIAVPLLGMAPFWAGSAVLLAALPTGALVFTLAQNYGIYVQRASAATLITTIVSVITVPIVLIVMGLR